MDHVNEPVKFEVHIALPVPEIIGGTLKLWAVPEYAHAPFSPKFQWAFDRMAHVKSIALPVSEIIWDTLKHWAVPGYAHAPFYPKFLMGFCSDHRMDPVNVPAKLEVRSFTRSWAITGYLKTLGSPWLHPRSLFSKIFSLMGFCSDGTCECNGQIWSP